MKNKKNKSLMKICKTTHKNTYNSLSKICETTHKNIKNSKSEYLFHENTFKPY